MPSNDLIGDWNKTPVWTIDTPDSRLLTYAPNPFVCASWRIAGLSRSLALEPDGENVRSPAKQRPEQLDLSPRRRILGDRLVVSIQCLCRLPRSMLRSGNVNGHIATVVRSRTASSLRSRANAAKSGALKSFAVDQSLETGYPSLISPKLTSHRLQSLKQFRVFQSTIAGR
jgi:hypothetical protein